MLFGIRAIVLSGAAAVLLAICGAASGATFNVTDPGDSGPGTLRQAILDANTSDTLDIIDLSAVAGTTITLTTGEIIISEPVRINGVNGNAPQVSGNGISRILFIKADTTVSDVNFIDGLARGGAGGQADGGGGGGGGGGMGGAIFVDSGNLDLTRCAFSGNTAAGGAGGGAGTWVDGLLPSGGGGGGAAESASGLIGGGGGALSLEGDGGQGGVYTCEYDFFNNTLYCPGSPGAKGGDFGGGGGGGTHVGERNQIYGGAGGFGAGGGGGGIADNLSGVSAWGGESASFGGSGAGGSSTGGGGGGGAGLGGALFIRAGTTTVTNCSFTANVASRGLAALGGLAGNGQGKGGAIFVHTGATLVDGFMTFTANAADDDLATLGDDDNIYGANVVPVSLSGAEAN